MVLTFPLRQATRLEASIEGDDGRGRRLRPHADAGGRPARGRRAPIAGKAVDVIETFAPGSSLQPIARTVTTDARGRISLPLSRGPSRSIAVAFAGTQRYLPARRGELGLTVRSTATLAVLKRRVRAGRKALLPRLGRHVRGDPPGGQAGRAAGQGRRDPPLPHGPPGVPHRSAGQLEPPLRLRPLLRASRRSSGSGSRSPARAAGRTWRPPSRGRRKLRSSPDGAAARPQGS